MNTERKRQQGEEKPLTPACQISLSLSMVSLMSLPVTQGQQGSGSAGERAHAHSGFSPPSSHQYNWVDSHCEVITAALSFTSLR